MKIVKGDGWEMDIPEESLNLEVEKVNSAKNQEPTESERIEALEIKTVTLEETLEALFG